MKIVFSTHFTRAYNKAPVPVQHALNKQLFFLEENLRHTSLRAKKYLNDRWQARVTRDWRFYFRIEGNTYILLDILKHPK